MDGRSDEFFHGTAYNIPVGQHVLPANKSGRSIWGSQGHAGQRSDEHAFATTNEDTAWTFANHAKTLGAGRFDAGYADHPVGRAHVLTVAPNPMMRPGVYNESHPDYNPESGNLHEYVAPRFRVTGRKDIMPGRQGTFPNLNWNQFSHPDMNKVADANHPRDEDIQGGHTPAYATRSYRDEVNFHTSPKDQEELGAQTAKDVNAERAGHPKLF